LQPVFGLKSGDPLEVGISRQDNQTILPRDRSDQQIELRHHLAGSTQLLEKIGEFRGRLIVDRPLAEELEGCLQTRQVALKTPAQCNASTILTARPSRNYDQEDAQDKATTDFTDGTDQEFKKPVNRPLTLSSLSVPSVKSVVRIAMNSLRAAKKSLEE